MPCPMCHDTGHYYVVGSHKEAILCGCLKGLEERIAAKTREIAATGLCQWKMRTAEEIAALPDEEECLHYAVTQDRVTGEVTCNACRKILIDSIGRVIDQ